MITCANCHMVGDYSSVIGSLEDVLAILKGGCWFCKQPFMIDENKGAIK